MDLAESSSLEIQSNSSFAALRCTVSIRDLSFDRTQPCETGPWLRFESGSFIAQGMTRSDGAARQT